MPSTVKALLAVVIAAALGDRRGRGRALDRRAARPRLRCCSADLARTAHKPFLATLVLFAVQQAVRATAGEFPGRSGVLHGLVILVIAAVAWLVAACVLVLEDVGAGPLAHRRARQPQGPPAQDPGRDAAPGHRGRDRGAHPRASC